MQNGDIRITNSRIEGQIMYPLRGDGNDTNPPIRQFKLDQVTGSHSVWQTVRR